MITEYVEQALRYQGKGELQAAVIELKNALQQNPKNTEARLLLGKIYVRLGDEASAQKELEIARERGEPCISLVLPLGKAYLLQGDAKQLLNSIWPQDEMRPEVKAEILTLRGKAYQLQGNLKEADTAFQDALVQQDTHNSHRPTG